MGTKLEKTLLHVCKLLEKFNVEYLIVGGTAVALNGYYRPSINSSGHLTSKPDIDIWYNPTYENYFALLEVTEALGQDISDIKKEKQPNPKKSFFKLEFEEFSLDLLPTIKADIKFFQAYSRKQTIKQTGVPIYFLSFTDLVEDKKTLARKKDLEDIDHLLKNRKENNKQD